MLVLNFFQLFEDDDGQEDEDDLSHRNFQTRFKQRDGGKQSGNILFKSGNLLITLPDSHVWFSS